MHYGPDAEGRPPQSLEMEAPKRLEEGVNFFDYPPFAAAVATTAQAHNMEHVGLRKIIALDAKMHFEKYKVSLVDYFRTNSATGRQHTSEAVDKGLRVLLQSLDNFPEWRNYVSANLDKGVYDSDGTFNLKQASHIAPSSYPEWLQRRLQRDQRLRAAAIRVVLVETFPQQLAGHTMSDVASESGARPTSRKWRIIKGSGISGGPR